MTLLNAGFLSVVVKLLSRYLLGNCMTVIHREPFFYCKPQKTNNFKQESGLGYDRSAKVFE